MPRVRAARRLALAALVLALVPASRARAGVTVGAGDAAPLRERPPVVATLDRTTLPATGRQVALLSVESFGRVAVTVKSPQGVALQLVDRVAGPTAVSGMPGASDGRVEGFLDHGEYRVVALASEKGTGEARLEAHSFRELSGARPPMLTPLSTVATTLGDFEQRSWWLHVPSRGRIALEIAGRALADLRLWRDGQWLVDAEPAAGELVPEEGRPLAVRRMSPELEPGIYLVTAYGGVPMAWANDDGRSPLLVRLGLPELAEAGRQRRVMSSFGLDRFVVPGEASFLRLELDESPASLGAGTYDVASPFASPDQVETITKETLPPAVDLEVGRLEGGRRVVTVTAPPGKAYVLQHFDDRERQYFQRSGRHYVSTIHSGFPADSIDATALLYRDDARWERGSTPTTAQVVVLSSTKGWARRFNLLEQTTLWLLVADDGDYVLTIDGVDAKGAIEPYLVNKPEGYEPPRPRGSGSSWSLNAGYHVLTLTPETIGIAEVSLRKTGLWDRITSVFGRERELGVPPLAPAVRFSDVTLDTDHGYWLHVNGRPGVHSGFLVRELPIDLSKALPVALAEGETLTLPVTLPADSVLHADLEDGTTLAMTVDGQEVTSEIEVSKGSHAVILAAPADGGPRLLSLVATPVVERRPLPELPDELAPRPLDLPVLAEGKPQFFDLEREETKTFLVRAAVGGLYRLETTGLLATEGNLRNRTVPSLVRTSSGGTGRNFLIHGDLQSGDYQVSVKPLGRSTGHLGLVLTRSTTKDMGALEEGVRENATLPTGQALAYDLVVAEDSTWRVRAYALDRTLRCRFEEEGGWPLEKPNGTADVTRKLAPGRYRFVVLPEPVEARIAVVADRIVEPVKREGHGPFDLALGRTEENLWLESPEGQRREPDRWRVVMPAAGEVTIQLTAGMDASIAGSDVIVRRGRAWTGELAEGEHVLEVVASRRDSKRPYTVGVRPTALMAGVERAVSAPQDLAVVSAPGGDLEIVSTGYSDVRARLLDEKGRVVASSDDATDDWNFRLSVPAWSGMRTLRVEPVGAPSAQTTIAMSQRKAAPLPGLALGSSADFVLEAGSLGEVPLTIPEGEGLLVVTARADRPVRLGVGGASDPAGLVDGRATDEGRTAWIAVPVVARSQSRLSLMVSSATGRRVKARLAAALALPRAVGPLPASGAVTTLELEPIAGLDDVRAAAVRLAVDGLMSIDAPAGMRLSGRVGRPARAAAPVETVSAPTAWLVARSARSTARVGRIVLVAGGEDLVVTPRGRASIEVATPSSEGTLVVATSPSGQPFLGQAAWRGGAAAIARASAGRSASVVLGDAPGSRSPVRLRAFDVTPLSSTVDVPGGAKRLRLALDAGTFAWTNGEDLVGAENQSTDTVLATSADEVTLVALPGSSGRHSVTSLADAEPPDVASGPFETVATHAGTIVLAPRAGALFHGQELHVRGVRHAWAVRDDGTLTHGSDVDPDGARELRLEHGVGPVAAWISTLDDADAAWGDAPTSAPRAVEAASAVALTGVTTTLRIERPRASLLTLRTTHPVVTRVRPDGEAPTADAWPSGARIDAWLPGGRAEIDLRGFAAEALAGEATVATSEAAPMREGLADEILLPAGEARAWTFSLRAETQVGLGVRASSDAVEAELLDAHGSPLGSGIVQLHSLPAGDYVLVVRAPADGPPVGVRPALLGTDVRTDPPEEALRALLESEAPPPSSAAPPAPGWEHWLSAQPYGSYEEPYYEGEEGD